MLEVEPGLLTAAGKLCDRQATHLGHIKNYVSDVCDRPAAFRGVLNLFQGSYGEAINAATKGLASSVDVAERMQKEIGATRDDFLAADRAAYQALEALTGDLDGLPPYEAPDSSGIAIGGSPAEAPPAGLGGDKLDGLDRYDFVDKGVDSLPGRDKTGEHERPDWAKSPQEHRDELRDRQFSFREEQDEQDVLHERRDRQNQEAMEAGRTAREEAAEDGATRREQRQADLEARQEVRDRNRETNRDVDNVSDGVGTAHDAYDEGKKLHDNIHKAGEMVNGIKENNETQRDLDKFRDREEDKDLQDWGARR